MAKDKQKKNKSEKTGIDHGDEVKRLNRIVGQIEGVAKMLEGGRKLDDVLMQCKAIHSALKSVEARLIKTHLEQLLGEVVKLDKKKSREQLVDGLEALFKQAN